MNLDELKKLANASAAGAGRPLPYPDLVAREEAKALLEAMREYRPAGADA